MDDDSDPIEEAATAAAEAQLDNEDDGGAETDADTRTGGARTNRWQGLRNDLSDRFADSADRDEEDPPSGTDADDDDEEEEPPSTGETTPTKGDQGQRPDKGKPAAGTAASRYEIVDGKGQKFAFALEPGTTIRVRGDKKTHEFTSMDDVIAAAQKGLAFDRVSSMAGQQRAALERQLTSLTQAREEDEDTLIQLVTDPAWTTLEAQLQQAGIQLPASFRTVRKALEKFADPDVRQAHKVLDREAATTEQQRTQAVSQFWEAVDAQIEDAVGGAGFELLTDEDVPEIRDAFLRVYENARAELERRYGTSDAAKQRAAQEAGALLTEETLTKVMQGVHQRYAKRLPPGTTISPRRRTSNGAAADPALDERAGKRAAEQHNARNAAKLRQRDQSRSLRGGGAAAGGGPAKPGGREPKSFNERMERSFGRFRKLMTDDD